ncbi:9615_t:CDS:1 [Ambispora gerdemannii]|uniref:9615_t:CDS:1 n=1 Tax=Ambispora gerdemannii TaxID=144530 RepID=A0A9N8YMM3_9GLOM|nr:9615_t:CDS:1 [Ambispora gerdemannii]
MTTRSLFDECHENLLRDAQFYGLTGLIKEIEERYRPNRFTSRHTYVNPFLMHKKHLAYNLRDLDVEKLSVDELGYLVWQDQTDAKKYLLHIHAQDCILSLGLHRSDESVKVSLEFHDSRDIKVIQELTEHFGAQLIKSENIAEEKIKIGGTLKGKSDISDVFLNIDDINCTLWELLHFRDYLSDINVTGPKRQRMLELDNIIYNDWVFGDTIYGRFYVVDIDFTLPPLYMHRAKLLSEQRWARNLPFVQSS